MEKIFLGKTCQSRSHKNTSTPAATRHRRSYPGQPRRHLAHSMVDCVDATREIDFRDLRCRKLESVLPRTGHLHLPHRELHCSQRLSELLIGRKARAKVLQES